MQYESARMQSVMEQWFYTNTTSQPRIRTIRGSKYARMEQAGRQAGRPTDRRTETETKSKKKTERQADQQTSRQAGVFTDRDETIWTERNTETNKQTS